MASEVRDMVLGIALIAALCVGAWHAWQWAQPRARCERAKQELDVMAECPRDGRCVLSLEEFKEETALLVWWMNRCHTKP